jgi:hypothetical protein
MRLEAVVAGRVGPMRRPAVAIRAAKIAFRCGIGSFGRAVRIRVRFV